MFSSNSLHPGEDWWENEKEYHESWNSLFDFTPFIFFIHWPIVPGHCKKLKPDWDKLMDEFNGSPGSLVADVDCTTEGQSLCEKHEATRHNGLITTDIISIISHHIESH